MTTHTCSLPIAGLKQLSQGMHVISVQCDIVVQCCDALLLLFCIIYFCYYVFMQFVFLRCHYCIIVTEIDTTNLNSFYQSICNFFFCILVLVLLLLFLFEHQRCYRSGATLHLVHGCPILFIRFTSIKDNLNNLFAATQRSAAFCIF